MHNLFRIFDQRLYTEFNSMIYALRSRELSNPKDRSYALYGALKVLGIPLAPPDYSKSTGEIYKDLFSDLLRWRPTCIALLLDAGQSNFATEVPTWVPQWEQPAEDEIIHSFHFPSQNTDAELEVIDIVSNWLWSVMNICNVEQDDWEKEEMLEQLQAILVGEKATIRSTTRTLYDEGAGSDDEVSWEDYDYAEDTNADEDESNGEGSSSRQGFHEANSPEETGEGDSYNSADVEVRETLEDQPIDDENDDEDDEGFSVENGSSLLSIPMSEDFDAWFQLVIKSLSTGTKKPAYSSTHTLAAIRDDPSAYGFHDKLCTRICGERSLFVTKRKRLGTGPFWLKDKDKIFHISGVSEPISLRAQQEKGKYVVLGPVLLSHFKGKTKDVKRRFRKIILI
ncbi:hypothetical protein N0V90_010994 [Kalmusia sp. IMI 367209]|nr:hypothetical protein N0V90_010994 [Kalmusia sp. IMI 367209]